MKKMSLVIAMLSTTLFSGASLALDSKYTTQHPIYQLDKKVVLGRVESVYLDTVDDISGIPFAGKIDTGADTTSMHAEDIHITSGNPKYKGLKDKELMKTIVDEYGGPKSNWWLESFDTPERNIQGVVSFTIRHPYTGEKIAIERPLARTSVIKSRTSEEPLYRPVIDIPLTIAGTTVMTDVNLTDRSQFSAPILIGKTFLTDNAWVFAGYDYLQEQESAQVVGKKEQVNVDGIELNVSFSLRNDYSMLHALNIDVDKKANLVSFDMVGKDGKKKAMSLPMVRMLKVGGDKRPLVYIPVEVSKGNIQHWMVYLRDRSGSKSQLRVGTSTINQNFMIDSSASNVLDKAPIAFSHIVKNKKPLIISPLEQIELDGLSLKAKPSLSVKTPLLKVTSFEVFEKEGKDQVEFYVEDRQGNEKKLSKEVVKNIRVGDTVRPVVEGSYTRNGQATELQYALEVLDEDEKKPYFILGQKMSKDGVYINPRSEYLLQSYPLFKAGHIEMAKVEGLEFPVKLDTGADVSSINAHDIKLFKKDGKDMVSFIYENRQGDKHAFTKPVVDIMRIRAKKGEEANVRPVVEMMVKLGDLEKIVHVNLQDRERFRYSMILGKNFLKYGAVVSSDENFILGGDPADKK
ncbi:RimK/LysX family protein [Vibrio kyushuensis]|uniref:ATP-dependent zinc protease family protein n=1 Tax=Vibrio kyushuensis TaxID=2910249 RepID=UPI003D0EDD50